MSVDDELLRQLIVTRVLTASTPASSCAPSFKCSIIHKIVFNIVEYCLTSMT